MRSPWSPKKPEKRAAPGSATRYVRRPLETPGQGLLHWPDSGVCAAVAAGSSRQASFQGCRSVEEFQCLNRIEEGTYGVVYRAKDKKTGGCGAEWSPKGRRGDGQEPDGAESPSLCRKGLVLKSVVRGCTRCAISSPARRVCCPQPLGPTCGLGSRREAGCPARATASSQGLRSSPGHPGPRHPRCQGP